VWERVQALKLIRAITVINPAGLSRCILKSVISVAGNVSDPLRCACLETIRELAVKSTADVSQSGGLVVLVAAAVDHRIAHMADALLTTLAFLLNHPDKRSFLRPALDLSMLLASFTDTRGAYNDDCALKWTASRRALVTLMRTWAGMFSICTDTHGLRALVQMLVQPVSGKLRMAILQTFLEILLSVDPATASRDASSFGGLFHAMDATTSPKSREAKNDSSNSNDDSPEGGHLSSSFWGVGPGAAGAFELSRAGFQDERIDNVQSSTHSLLDNFISVVLVAFVYCGLLQALVQLSLASDEQELSNAAMHFLSYVLRKIARYLPENLYRQTLSIPLLLERAIKTPESVGYEERVDARRAVGVIKTISETVGLGYDGMYAAMLTRAACDNGVALASELSLAASGRRGHLPGRGIFPRSGLLQLSHGGDDGVDGPGGGGFGIETILEEGSTSTLLASSVATKKSPRTRSRTFWRNRLSRHARYEIVFE
jgi:hypothetical protein